MRLVAHLVAALAVLPAALAVDQKKSAIVWFEDPTTPNSVLAQAKNDITKAGGQITHEYTIIKGFAVTAPQKALELVQVWGAEHSIRVDEDEMVSAQ